ncbi:MAG: CBS domain-containing protein [Gammaproteobacteria bacterium]|nr:CBS domain-containing protein [Gammaproteobacteria bacterium]
MSDDSSPGHKPSWLERLGQILQGEPKDREELLEVLKAAEMRHLIDHDAFSMIEGVMEVSVMQVRDVMVPRSQMVVIERDSALCDLLPVLIESGHSRFPVVGESRDDVVGILLAKDLLPVFGKGSTEDFALASLVRPVVHIPETKRLDALLKEFRASRNHMAIVVDEYGGVAGLVTIEDVLEEIVGDIEDEYDFDDEEEDIKPSGTNEYLVKALTPIEDFNEFFDAGFSNQEYDTVGGLVMQQIGHLPTKGESVDLGRFQFKVLSGDSRRIGLLQVRAMVESSPVEDGP